MNHYYGQRLLQREFWAKLLRGQVGVTALVELGRNLRQFRAEAPQPAAATYQQRMADAWRGFEGPLLLVLSGRDYTAKEFIDYASSDPAWRGALDHSRLVRRDFADADHTFSDAATHRALEEATLGWLEGERL